MRSALFSFFDVLNVSFEREIKDNKVPIIRAVLKIGRVNAAGYAAFVQQLFHCIFVASKQLHRRPRGQRCSSG